jgi:hypothetical protein
MVTYTPPGWPAGVHPPGSDDFESTAVGWLLDVVPPDYRLHGVLRRYPVALATMARYHSRACVEAAREGYRTARTELAGSLPPHAIDTVLAAYRKEGARLAATARAVGLVERALRGEVFTPKMSTSMTAQPPNAKTQTTPARTAETQTSRPQMAPARMAEPHTAQPRTAEPRTGQPRTGQPRTAQPRASQPRAADPKAAALKVAGPKVAGPKVAGPKVAGPKVAGPKVGDRKRTAVRAEAAVRQRPERQQAAGQREAT